MHLEEFLLVLDQSFYLLLVERAFFLHILRDLLEAVFCFLVEEHQPVDFFVLGGQLALELGDQDLHFCDLHQTLVVQVFVCRPALLFLAVCLGVFLLAGAGGRVSLVFLFFSVDNFEVFLAVTHGQIT